MHLSVSSNDPGMKFETSGVMCGKSSSLLNIVNDRLQYRINLVPIVPIDSQKKSNIALNDRLDPQFFLGFIACNGMPNVSSTVLFLFLCLKSIIAWKSNRK